MRLAIVVLVVTSVLCDVESLKQIAQEVNEAGLWEAVYQEGVAELARSQLMRIAPLTQAKAVPQVYDLTSPTNFDGRTAWPGCIHPVLDQGRCGSCWSFAASEVLSDRFCIASNGRVNVVLSPQNLLSCEKKNLGCAMGSLPEWAWDFLNTTGITTLACTPYVNYNGGSVPACQKTCAESSTPFVKYRASTYEHVGALVEPSKHVAAIMSAVAQGPADATFNVYSDFLTYKSGVYKHTKGGYEGLHSVKIVGYGVENGTDYWLVQNSWGPSFGIDGFFKIIRGVDDCGFESLVYTGAPRL